MLRHSAAGCLIAGILLTGPQLYAQNQSMAVAVRAADQLIRPGDRIVLRLLGVGPGSDTLMVNERGEAVFTRLGVINLGNVRIGALRDTLMARYRDYIREPEVDVSVYRRVVVNGQVRTPDVYYLDTSSGVRDAIAKAGGPLETASRSKVTVVRGARRISVPRWETDQGPEADLQSGDQVIVGRQSWFALNALPLISTSVIVIGLLRSLRP